MQVTSTNLRRARPLLGTFVEIDVADADERHAEDAVEAAFAAVAEVHRLMSFHEADSDVSRLNRAASSERGVGPSLDLRSPGNGRRDEPSLGGRI